MRLHFRGSVPLTASLAAAEIEYKYEHNTGLAIVRRFAGLDPLQQPGVLVANHGPFAWGKSASEAAHHAVVLEEIALIAAQSVALGEPRVIERELLDKHFLRKHGPKKYYGQEE